MKKSIKMILSAALSASIAVSTAAIPALADYTASDYDVEQFNYTYDDGTVTNGVDGTSALQVTADTTVFTLSDTTIMTNEFLLSFDFCFDTVDGTVPGTMTIRNSGKYGPIFSYDSGNLRTQTGSSSYQTIAAISPDTWYTAEIEGKMVVSDAYAVMRVYDSEGNLVNELENLNLRQFYSSSSNGNPDRMVVSNGISIDNLRLISENPDEIAVTAALDEVNAGNAVVMDYTMLRQSVEMTKYSVTWSVYDEANENEITDGTVSMTSSGQLVVDIDSPDQVVTVRAAADFNNKTLVGTKQVTIKAVDVSSEKFDAITITGSQSVKAGTSASYTFTATKNGTDVTADLTTDDVAWSVYDYANINPSGNTAFTIEDGVLTVADGTIPQTVYIRASTPSGNVFGSLAVATEFGTSQQETVLGYDACEEPIDTATTVTSIDGSYAYYTTATTKLINFGNTSDYVLTELDVKFEGEGSGFTLDRADGTLNSCFRYHNGSICLQTGSSSYSAQMTADTDTWYHLEVLYSSGNADASVNIYTYNADGTMGEPKTCLDISLRNGKDYGTLQIEPATYIDNVKISTPAANELTITPANNTMFAGETNQVTASAYRNSLPLKDASGVTWEVLDEEGLPIIDGTVSIDPTTGLVTVDALADAQTITVRATSSTGTVATAEIIIQSSELFTVTNIGVNEDDTKIVKLYFDMNFTYVNDVTFIIGIYGADGTMKGVTMRSNSGKSFSVGSNEVTLDYTLPDDFDPDSDTINVFVWTRM